MEDLKVQSDNGSAKADDKTAFEKRYADLKAAKLLVREKQSEVTRIANQMVDLKKRAHDADISYERAKKNVDVVRDGLEELFASEMRNY